MAEYITIRDRQYRVEVSMGALEAFLETVGTDDLKAVDLKILKNQMIMMAICMAAGEEMDGRDTSGVMDAVTSLHVGEFREAFDAFAAIYERQCAPSTGAAAGSKKK